MLLKRAPSLSFYLLILLALLIGCQPSGSTVRDDIAADETDTATDQQPTSEEATASSDEATQTDAEAPEEAAPVANWSDKTFVKVLIALPKDLDPHGLTFDAVIEPVIRTLYEPLADYNPETGELQGILATEWSVDDEAKVYTFKLREGVKFHDGTDLTAEAVKLSFERTIAQNGARAQFIRGIESIEIIDDLTVAIHLEEPNPVFLSNIQDILIASAEAVNAHFDDDWFLTNEAGSYAYRLADQPFEPTSDIMRFEPFEEYWGGWGRQGFVTELPEGAQHIGRLEMRVVPESATQRLLLESGEAHFMQRFPISYIAEMQNNPEVKVVNVPAYRISLLPLNVAHGPLQDIRLRRMLQYAFPYDAYIQYYQGLARPAVGPINPEFLSDPTLEPFEQDLEMARALLEEAGYGPNELTLTYLYPTGGEEQKQPGILLQDALSQIGVTLEVDTIPWTNIVERVASGPENAPDIMTLINTPKGTDPGVAFLFQFYHTVNLGGPYNWSYYENPEVDALLDQAITTLDEEERLELYRQAQRLVLEDAVSVYLAYPDRWVAMTPKVDGFWMDPIGSDWEPWYDMYWTE